MATITRRGDYWRAQIRRKGYAPLTKTFNTKTEAQAWSRVHESAMDSRTFTAAGPEHKTSLAELLQRYEQQVLPGARHPAQTRQRVAHWLAQPVAAKRLSDIGPSDFSSYRDRRRAQGRADNTIRLELALISRVYNLARKEWGFATLANPLRDVEKPSGSAERDRRLRPGEEEAMLCELRRSTNPYAAVAFLLAIETALRQGALMRLRWSWIDLDRRIVTIPPAERGVKNKGVPKELPLSTRAVVCLRDAPRPVDGTVIGCSTNAIVCVFKKARARVAGSHDLRWHDLRHEAASRLFERGLNVMEVASVTGHRSMQMLRRYTHLRAENLVAKLL